MAKFTVEVDFDEYNPEHESMEHYLVKQIVNHLRYAADGKLNKTVLDELEKAFSEEAKEAVKSAVDGKMQAFFGEDIALTDRWGKVWFVGSIEDLIKKQFDDALLHPVNDNGHRLEGCRLEGGQKTYVQWMLETKISGSLKSTVSNELERARRAIAAEVTAQVDTAIKGHLKEAVAAKVNAVI